MKAAAAGVTVVRRARGRLVGAVTLAAALLPLPAAVGGSQDEAQLRTLRKQIQELAGDGRCNNVVHCRAIPIGKRDCGGPDEYVIFSSMTGKAGLLEAKAFEYTFLQEEILRGKAGVGACEMVVEPRLACIQQRCRAVQ